MAVENVHDFHLILDRSLKEKLKGLDVFGNSRGLSGVIVKILQLLSPVVRRVHKWGKQRCGKYMNVCHDADEIREHVHVYLPGKMYRELKLMHQDLNAYSIAQLLRGFVNFFLVCVEVFGGGVVRELESLFACWSEEEKKDRLTLREYMRQLFAIIRHLPGKSRPVHIYDGNFSPFWVFRI